MGENMTRGLNKQKEEFVAEAPEEFGALVEAEEKQLEGELEEVKEPEQEEHEVQERRFEEKRAFDLLSLYLNAMDEYSLFTPAQEVAKAKEIQELKDRVWEKVSALPFFRKKDYPEYSEHAVKESIEKMDCWSEALKSRKKSEWIIRKETGLTKKRMFRAYREISQTQRKLEKRRNEFVEANLRLVVKIANRYRNQAQNYSVSIADLIQDGNLGLIRAVEKFDWSKGFKFSSYATWWIHQAIIRSLAEKSRLIKVPVYLTEKVRRLSKATRLLAQQLEKEPNLDELAERLDMEAEEILNLLRISKEPISLEGQIGDLEEVCLGDMIEDKNSPRADEHTARQDLVDQLEDALKLLSPREEQVLRLRYGLGGEEIKTLEEIGNMFGVSRERVRQIEQKGLRKLRHPARSKVLRSFFKN